MIQRRSYVCNGIHIKSSWERREGERTAEAGGVVIAWWPRRSVPPSPPSTSGSRRHMYVRRPAPRARSPCRRTPSTARSTRPLCWSVAFCPDFSGGFLPGRTGRVARGELWSGWCSAAGSRTAMIDREQAGRTPFSSRSCSLTPFPVWRLAPCEL